MSTSATLDRTTFTTSRLLEFFSTKELQMQMAADPEDWPLALVKELIDNALDACETAGVVPAIAVTVTEDTVTVQDNGPGLPISTLERSLDYQVRVSDKAYYVSPTRGQLGNALKCLWAAPYVACGEQGAVTITTGGQHHHVTVALNRIEQAPDVQHTVSTDGFVKTGTRVAMHWPGIASSLLGDRWLDFYKTPGTVADVTTLLDRYAAFNPHATFTLTTSELQTAWQRTVPEWQKWLPTRPTSPHWYDQAAWRGLLMAYLSADRRQGRTRTVREVVAEFAGLSGTAKQKAILGALGLARATLEDLVQDNDVDPVRSQQILTAMCQQSRVVKPQELGLIGSDHLIQVLTRYGMDPESVRYQKRLGTDAGVPYVIEVAFGWNVRSARHRQVVIGLNWASALKVPLPQLSTLLGEYRLDSDDPIVLAVHLACPRLHFTDRGKGTVALPDAITAALRDALGTLAKPWKTFKRQADNNEQVRQRDIDAWNRHRRAQKVSAKEAAYQVMAQAYALASSGGTLPANARQIMYAARPLIIALTHETPPWKNSAYFTQHLLPDFLRDHPALTADWDVVFDARGHLQEPHTGYSFGLGTLEVRQYLHQWRHTLPATPAGLIIPHEVETRGPALRYRFALFVEKEGFNQLIARAQIQARYDLALMSTKGMSVTAARTLVEELTRYGVTILVLHDFDKSSFAIVHTLRTNTRRFAYQSPPNVIDIGLRGVDVDTMQLERESVFYQDQQDPREYLRHAGATEDECAILVQERSHASGRWTGERVELNAMPSAVFLRFLDDTLQHHGVTKLVPDATTLAAAYKQMLRLRAMQQAVDTALQTSAAVERPTPGDLPEQVSRLIKDTTIPWDEAVWRLTSAPELEE